MTINCRYYGIVRVPNYPIIYFFGNTVGIKSSRG